MKSLAIETFTPTDQKKKDTPTTYQVKALTSLQLTEVMSDGGKLVEGGIGLSFKGVTLCLKYGLLDETIKGNLIDTMPSSHHSEVAGKIFRKALLSEDERKNS